MKQLISILIMVSLVVTFNYDAQAKKKNKLDETAKVDTVNAALAFVPNVTIHTPTTEIYDDGMDIVRYEGYSVYDIDNNQVLKIGTSMQNPVRLKMQPGDYFVKLNGQKSPIYRISVKENQYNEFVIEDTKE